MLETPFGTFVGSNLTPDPLYGLGAWSEADFATALRQGHDPAGEPLWPAFPYPSFTGLSDSDIADLWAFLGSVAPSPNQPPPQAPRFPRMLGLWQRIAFDPGPFEPEPSRDEAWNRGAYLVEVVGHCGECHTPRNPIGKPKSRLAFAGTDAPPEPAPDIRPATLGWDPDEWMDFLTYAEDPEGEPVGGEMRRVVLSGSARLSEADRAAIAAYMLVPR